MGGLVGGVDLWGVGGRLYVGYRVWAFVIAVEEEVGFMFVIECKHSIALEDQRGQSHKETDHPPCLKG